MRDDRCVGITVIIRRANAPTASKSLRFVARSRSGHCACWLLSLSLLPGSRSRLICRCGGILRAEAMSISGGIHDGWGLVFLGVYGEARRKCGNEKYEFVLHEVATLRQNEW